MPTVYINESETFFLDKSSARATFVDFLKEEDCYLYDIRIKIDLEKIASSKINKIFVLLNNNLDSENNSSSFNGGGTYASMSTATSAVLNVEEIETLFDIMTNLGQKNEITSIDPKQFIDLDRFKNNFTGASGDKFGRITQMKTTVVSKTHGNDIENLLGVNFSLTSPNLGPKIESGLYNGKGIIKTLNLSSYKRKGSLDKHQITTQDQAESENSVPLDHENLGEFGPSAAQVSAQHLDYLNELSTLSNSQTVSIQHHDGKIRNVSFLLKIKNKDVINANLDQSGFYLHLEARSKNNTKLDSQSIFVNLENDLSMQELTLQNLTLGIDKEQSTTEILLHNTTNSQATFVLHRKCLYKNIPFYKNYFEEVSAVSIPSSKSKASFVVANKPGVLLSPRPDRNVVTPVFLDVPKFYRITAKIAGVNLDNCFELSFPSKNTYENKHVPFVATSRSGPKGNFIQLVIDPNLIPKRYRKIKILKSDISRNVFLIKDYLTRSKNEVGDVINPVALSDSRGYNRDFITLNDYDVREDEFYQYILELVDDVGRVEKIYSTTSFQEKLTSPSGYVNFTKLNQHKNASSVTVNVMLTVNKNDSQLVFKSLMRDAFPLFQNELDQIKSDTVKTIVLGIEKICLEDGTIDFLGYFQDPRVNLQNTGGQGVSSDTDRLEFALTDNINPKKNYYYKATAYVKPVAEIISAIRSELRFRDSSSPGANSPISTFPTLVAKIKSLQTSVLNEISDKYATRSRKRGLIIDPQTRSSLNNGNAFADASTGDTAYVLCPSDNVNETTGDNVEIGDLNITYAESKSINHRDLATKEVKNKFLVSFSANFYQNIDHCAIFLLNKGQLQFCCNMHVDPEKSTYSVLIEKNNLHGIVTFLAFPIDVFGSSIGRKMIGSFNVGE
tara:strand:+ start:3062 stop:5755 length:2694 start_codon:yes stop_codon:yes gene_type:complete